MLGKPRFQSHVFAIPLAILIGFTLTLSASAEIKVSVDSDGSTNIDLGTPGAAKTINFYIGQDAGSSDTLAAIFADYSIAGGAIPEPPGQGTISSTGAGTPGYYGAGNLDISAFNRPGSTSFNINQSFDFQNNMPQPIKNEPQRDLWFTLNLDTTGMAPDIYTISLDEDPSKGFFDPTGARISANNNLSFTVSAIPEPSSLAVVGLVGLSSVLVRRRKPNRERIVVGRRQ